MGRLQGRGGDDPPGKTDRRRGASRQDLDHVPRSAILGWMRRPSSAPLRIALSGPSGSGKTTVARILEREHGFRIIAIGSLVRSFVSVLFGHQRKATLDALVTAIRKIDPAVWHKFAIREAERLNHPCVLDSVRFRKDAPALRAAGFFIWRVAAESRTRHSRLRQRDPVAPQRQPARNPIEDDLNNFTFDAVIRNDYRTLGPLKRAVSRALELGVIPR